MSVRCFDEEREVRRVRVCSESDVGRVFTRYSIHFSKENAISFREKEALKKENARKGIHDVCVLIPRDSVDAQ